MNMPATTEAPLFEACRAIYSDVQRFYDEHPVRIGGEDLGFRVLYSPPLPRPEILFLGFQPGGRLGEALESQRLGHREGWPTFSDYATADWLLARRMRSIWPIDVINRSVGMNAIFFRAPSIKDWNSLPAVVRLAAEEFSARHVAGLIQLLSPRRIVVIGLGTFDRLTHGEALVRGYRKQVLIKEGRLWGRPAYGVVHLSGARIAREDLNTIRSYFASFG